MLQSAVYLHVFFYITAGLDYNETVEILIFNSTLQRIIVEVPIVQDEFSESNEQFSANLSIVESNGIKVDLSPEQAIVNITDEKGMAK